jgi:hypothetical protein
VSRQRGSRRHVCIISTGNIYQGTKNIMGFAKFMAGPIGRGVRIIAGVILVLVGLLSVGDVGGIVLAAVGVVVFLAGALNVCLISPILGAPFSGKKALES